MEENKEEKSPTIKEEGEKEVKNEDKKIHWVLLILVLGFLLYKTTEYFGVIGYRETWSICIDYMKDGVLWTGQPHCEGAIVPFYIISFLDALVGREYVQFATFLFSTIISGIFFWIFIKVVKEEIKESSILLPALLFGVLFYINMVTNIEAVLNSFFFFLAYFVLFHKEYKCKYYLCGTFLLLAILSKINVIVPIAFLLTWHVYTQMTKEETERTWEERIKRIRITPYIKIATPIALGLGLCTIMYEKFWMYSWHIFTNQTIALSVIETIKEMVFININEVILTYIPLTFIAILATYLFWKEKKFYALIGGPCLLISMFTITRAFGIDFVVGTKYYSVIFPFTILVLLQLRKLWTTTPKKQLYQAAMLLILIFPALYIGPLQFHDDLSYVDSFNILDRLTETWQEKDEFVKQIHYGYSVIPELDGKILMEHEDAGLRRMLISIGANIPEEKQEVLSKRYMASHPDVWGYPRYVELLGDELIEDPDAKEDLNEKEREIIERVDNGEFSLIIIGPPEWAITDKIILNSNLQEQEGACQIYIPNNVWLTYDGWHYSKFIFSKTKYCTELIENMATYFAENFSDICSKDKETANSIGDTLRMNPIDFPLWCMEGGSALEYYKNNKGIKRIELVVVLTLIALPFILQFVRGGRREKNICKIVLFIIILCVIGVLITMQVPLPYTEAVIGVLN
jgi:hypothetical protein